MQKLVIYSIALAFAASAASQPLVEPPQAVKVVPPDYSGCLEAPKAPVAVHVTVSGEGTVTKAIARSAATPCQALAAASAARQFRFLPVRLLGQPVQRTFFITLHPIGQKPPGREAPESI